MIKPNKTWFLRFLLIFLGLGVLLLIVEVSLTGERPNYSLIRAGLYQGGYVKSPPPKTKAVLNLCRLADPYKVEAHLWEPVKDSTPAPSITWLKKQVKFIDEQRQAGKTVYVHCRNGVSRSGMVVVAYVMYKDKLPRDKALAQVRTKRPITRPNPAFMERLLEWERALKTDFEKLKPGIRLKEAEKIMGRRPDIFIPQMDFPFSESVLRTAMSGKPNGKSQKGIRSRWRLRIFLETRLLLA
jgi:protein-tyrosine phosphatase